MMTAILAMIAVLWLAVGTALFVVAGSYFQHQRLIRPIEDYPADEEERLRERRTEMLTRLVVLVGGPLFLLYVVLSLVKDVLEEIGRASASQALGSRERYPTRKGPMRMIYFGPDHFNNTPREREPEEEN